ncbi:regulatory protein [Calothrix parasitica NIES-267]|uniref:Regulatory protein n=1 Tax=Calothrix parasitica NIES-267 TaxID=1973488 RepID=A0A1Z4LTW6_9CYAN|nr:regulatory protein [Calothrix parasitica NIES-267]
MSSQPQYSSIQLTEEGKKLISSAIAKRKKPDDDKSNGERKTNKYTQQNLADDARLEITTVKRLLGKAKPSYISESLFRDIIKVLDLEIGENLIEETHFTYPGRPNQTAHKEPVITTKHKTSTLSQLPPLPTHYVDRPEYSQDLKARLLTHYSDQSTLVVTAIHGLGSVGKSTLVAALVHDEEVQNHFNDGILWATLGQNPNLLNLLSKWIQALGDYNFKPTSVETASAHLSTLVYDKTVLLVVDDAWKLEDAKVFNVGGGNCQVLVTTREAVIAYALYAEKYSLDVMTPSQSMELVTKEVWTPSQALAYTLQSRNPQHKADALGELADYLPDNLKQLALEKALEAAKLIQDEYYRAKALSALADKLPPELLPDALEAAKSIQHESNRANVLSALADKLPSVLPDALEAAKSIQHEYYRANVLSALADKLPSVLPDALEAAKSIQDE